MDLKSVVDVSRTSVTLVQLNWGQSKIDTATNHEKPSKDKPDTSGEDKLNSRNSRIPSQQFEFVASTYPFRNRDPQAQRLVRSHVMKGFRRQQSQRITRGGQKSSEAANARAGEQLRSNSQRSMDNYRYNVVQTVPRINDALCATFPVEMSPQLYERLIRYLTTVPGATYPFDSPSRYNAVRAGWFNSTMADKGLFHSLLYFACLTTGMIDGDPKQIDTIIQLDATLSYINQKLSEPTKEIPSGVIDVLLCLALAQALLGHFENWNLHMAGLQKVILSKGGVSVLDGKLIIRLLLADIVGAAEFVVKSHFQFEKFGSLSTRSACIVAGMSNADACLIHILESSSLRSSTVTIFKEIHAFSRTVAHALNKWTISPDLNALSEDSLLLRHRLLCSPDVDWECWEHWGVDEACRLGALLYMRGIFREFPFSVIGARYVTRKLREALCRIPHTTRVLAPLILWLLFMGGISANEKSDKTWFVGQLVKVAAALKGQPWKKVKVVLRKVLWIEQIHEAIGSNLWKEVDPKSPT